MISTIIIITPALYQIDYSHPLPGDINHACNDDGGSGGRDKVGGGMW